MINRLIDIGANMLLAGEPTSFVEAYASLLPTFLNQIDAIPFNSKWYTKLYTDVPDAVSSGQFTSSFDHFVRIGFLAGRLGAPMPVDEGWYRAFYPDINQALTEGTLASASDHFQTHGFFESRAASAYHLVDKAWYKEKYPAAAFEIEMGFFQDPQDHYNRRGYALACWASQWSAVAV